jgi:hypothetical protein
MNEIVKPSGHEFYFMLRQVETSSEEDLEGDNATFQAKLSKSPSGDFQSLNIESSERPKSDIEIPPTIESSSSEFLHMRKAGSEGSLISGAKNSIRKKDLALLKIPKRDSMSSDSSDFSPSTMSSTSPALTEPSTPTPNGNI